MVYPLFIRNIDKDLAGKGGVAVPPDLVKKARLLQSIRGKLGLLAIAGAGFCLLMSWLNLREARTVGIGATMMLFGLSAIVDGHLLFIGRKYGGLGGYAWITGRFTGFQGAVLMFAGCVMILIGVAGVIAGMAGT